MSEGAPALEIRRNLNQVAFEGLGLAIYAAALAVMLRSEPLSACWWLLLVLAFQIYGLVGAFRARRYVVFDASGVRLSGRPGGVVRWSRIEACAWTDGGRKVLRLFLAPAATALAPQGERVDIDFTPALRSREAFEAAYRLCVDEIAARSGVAPESVVRVFDDAPQPAPRWPRRRAIGVVLLVVLAVAAIALALRS